MIPRPRVSDALSTAAASRPDQPVSPLAQDLKAGTSLEHTALEASLRLMAPDCTLRDYARFLAALAAFHGAVEAALPAALSEWGPQVDIAGRRKLPWLQADLAVLVELRAPEAGTVPTFDLPPLDTPSAGFGALYVLEGSTLGGPSIRRHLDARLPPTWRTAARFIEGYGRTTVTRWREFREVLERFAGGDKCDRDAAVGTARECFSRLHTMMQEHGAAL